MTTIDSLLNLIDERLAYEASLSPIHYGWDEDDYEITTWKEDNKQ